VPLSEDEQRILHQIEQQFYATDPAFAREVGTTTLYRHAFRNLKLASAGFMAGLAILVTAVFLTVNFLLAFAFGFVPMLLSGLWFERNARKLGRAGMQQMTATMKGAGLKDSLGGARDRIRDRFRRQED
jgi:Protein of unknown function (DUF3040)